MLRSAFLRRFSLAASRLARGRAATFVLGAALATVLALASQAAARPRALLVPPREGSDVNTLGVERDGTRRIVAYGLRALSHPDGAMQVAEEVFPLARAVQALELPRRFGGGFLFTISSSGRSSIWKAKTFTDKLEPFAQLDFEVERLAPGFDRVYLQARRTGEWAALDPESGAGLDRGSLPRSPAFGAMAFADEWFGAVELPIVGVVASFDAGGTWHPLGRAVQLLGEEQGELLLATPDGRRHLGADGLLHPLEGSGSAASDGVSDSARRLSAEGPFGKIPLAAALLRGFPDTKDTAVVAARGSLARVRLRDGSVLALRKHAFSASSECVALPLEQSFGFACREPEGKTELYAFKPPLGLSLLASFESSRAILASGNGGLVLRGACPARAGSPGRSNGYCVRAPDGQSFEIPAGPGAGRERVVALRDGGAARLLPPEFSHKGQLSLFGKGGGERVLPLVFDVSDEATRTLLNQGFWLDGLVQGSDGKLSGWVLGRAGFVGVRIALDGHVRAGPPHPGIERALLSGEHALVASTAGVAEQSVDGGLTFTDVDLPPDVQLDSVKIGRTPGVIEQGCSLLGCVFGGWLRVGWDGPTDDNRLPLASAPKPTSLPQPGGGRWILRCAPNGESSAPALSSPAPNMPEGQAPWLGLFEQPPPNRGADAIGFDTGGDGELRAYAWGPKGADFSKAGRFVVSALDVFRAKGGVWSTLPGPSPWADAAQVAETFGYEGSTPSAWHLDLDPSGRAGVLSVAVRGSTDLFAIEENRAPVRLINAGRQGVGSVTSVVRLGATFYVAAQDEPRSTRVFALEGGEARLLGQYADLPQGRGVAPTLVRSVRGDALGIWTRAAGWFVFPLDLRTGAVTSAIEITPPELAKLPRVCAPDEQGYLLEGPVGIEPYVDFAEGAERVSAHGYQGRFVVSDQGVCVGALAAQSDASIAHAAPARAERRAPAVSVPLVVSDRSERGRRWTFRCTD
jgi:hypothetical protein